MIKKLCLPAALIALSTLLSACSSIFGPPPKSSVEMWFTVDHGAQLGIVRAMTDGQRTIIQLKTTDPVVATVTEETGWTIPWTRVGPYMVVSGVQPEIHVRIGEADATIRLTQ